MVCFVWKKLMEEWSAASARFREAVIASTGLTGKAFEDAQLFAEQAKKECHQAEEALRQHEAVHACRGPRAKAG